MAVYDLPARSAEQRLLRIARWCGIGSILIGISGLLGWVFNLPVLNSIIPGYKPIAISAAIAFILLGSVQLFLTRASLALAADIVLLGISIFFTLFGLLEIVFLVTGVNVTIEEAFLKRYPLLYANPDVHISPVAGILVFLIGLAQSLLLLQRLRGISTRALGNAAGLLGSLTAAISAVFLLSYLFGAPLLYGGAFLPIAALAALAALLLGIGIMATAGYEALPLTVFAGESTRARLFRAFLPVTALMLLLWSMLQFLLTRLTRLNPAISAATLTIFFEVVLAVIILQVARGIGNLLDQAEQERRKVEKERLHLSEEVAAQRKLFQTVVEYAPAGIAILQGPEHRYVLTNPAYAPFVAGKGDILERTVAEVFPEIADTIIPLLDHVFQTGEPYNAVDMPLTLRRNGRLEDTYITFSYTPWRDEQGHIQGVLALAIETTERVRVTEELRRLNETLEQRVRTRTAALEAANKELEAFSYSVSHDLRSPLRGIDGFSRILLEKYSSQVDAQGQDYLARVRAAAQRMGRLIDDMLNLSRIGRAQMRRETVNLSALATAIVDDLRQRDPERRVDVDIMPDMLVSADPALLQIVLDNLLGNAWKFTSKREVARIEAGMTMRDHEKVYYIRDNGAGFDMSYADKLFTPFQRLHTEQEFPGTGIGLAIVQRIIARHGGRVWAEGAEGQGATIYFTLGETEG